MHPLLSRAISWPVFRIGLRTSLLVGTLLNLVNQWYGIFYDWDTIHWVPFALNYCVPYLVASYGAASMAVTASGRARSGRERRVEAPRPRCAPAADNPAPPAGAPPPRRDSGAGDDREGAMHRASGNRRDGDT